MSTGGSHRFEEEGLYSMVECMTIAMHIFTCSAKVYSGIVHGPCSAGQKIPLSLANKETEQKRLWYVILQEHRLFDCPVMTR